MDKTVSFKKLFSAFIIGSSWIVFSWFFKTFYNYKSQYSSENCITGILGVDPYYFYTLAAPLYLGLMSVLGVYLSNYMHIYIAFFIVALLSALFVSVAITQCKVYTFSDKRLTQQYMGILKYHILFYFFIANLYLYLFGEYHLE